MNQRTTGLVVGLVIFVILTVGLLASTIYFNIEMNDAKVKERESTATAKAAQLKEGKSKTAYSALTSFVTGDPSQSADSPVEDIKKALGAMEDYGLPKPDHEPLEAHPSVSGEFLTRAGCGDITFRPGIKALEGRQADRLGPPGAAGTAPRRCPWPNCPCPPPPRCGC